MKTTEQQLADDVVHYLWLARGNYFALWTMYVVAVAASIIATLFAATKLLTGGWLAVLTAVPAVVLLVNNTFKFDARSQWHYEKKRRLASLLRLSQAGAKATSPAEVAEKWNRIDEEMDKLWPSWGALPTARHKAEDASKP